MVMKNKNKRGLSLPIELIVVLIIVLIVLIVIMLWFPETFWGSTEVASVFSVPANAYIIEKCNSYCDVLKGGGDGISSLGEVDVRYLYCQGTNPFRGEKGQKKDISCSEAFSELPEFKIKDCNSFCT